MTVLRFPRRRRVSRTGAAAGRFGSATIDPAPIGADADALPPNVRFLLTPDHDPALDYLDSLPDLEFLDDTEREARIAVARLTGS